MTKQKTKDKGKDLVEEWLEGRNMITGVRRYVELAPFLNMPLQPALQRFSDRHKKEVKKL